MTIFVFKCETCQTVDDQVEMTADEYVGAFDCAHCEGRMLRVWGGVAPALGKIEGAGRSPIRGQL